MALHHFTARCRMTESTIADPIPVMNRHIGLILPDRSLIINAPITALIAMIRSEIESLIGLLSLEITPQSKIKSPRLQNPPGNIRRCFFPGDCFVVTAGWSNFAGWELTSAPFSDIILWQQSSASTPLLPPARPRSRPRE